MLAVTKPSGSTVIRNSAIGFTVEDHARVDWRLWCPLLLDGLGPVNEVGTAVEATHGNDRTCWVGIRRRWFAIGGA